ncbi:NAD(P)H-binding protein [Chitinophaga arvensicola]|uniref:Uncharacterized conserved protein YbjT, contains NAD(P)-binding and DUF2867 domains n=1 Tax=Chitinophaga arvensicola TaxID=29529 RepID=A0A1I0S7V8_9BACT|nr:NAD(P)H-binding protein [Chitinophaga arvensicola]SEW51722.1 Uncharacterized conserved protein YbjT, contains NAD(P)-binding and DUF2867 domains [Chitinophaga arvensicola]
MKITLTGSLGNISRPLAQQLIAHGHTVTVISRSAEKAAAIEALHAIPAIGDVEDPAFLLRAFAQADAVYLMIPPNFQAADIKQYMKNVGDGYVQAIKQAGVKRVVNLSSIGAHLPDGPGPAGANHYVESRLNELTDTHVLHLRPGMFYTNFFGSIPMIRHQHIIGNNFDAQVPMVLSHPADIATTAANTLEDAAFTGKHIRYIASDEKTGGEIATILGKAIDQQELAWVGFSDEELLQGMMQGGFTEEMARVYVIEIGIALREGTLFDNYRKHAAAAGGQISFRTFADEFAAVYKHSFA